MKRNPIDTQQPRHNETDEMSWVDTWTNLLDTRFRVPGTKITFGADFLLGFIPGLGDVTSMGISGVLIATMAKNGASGRLIARMLLNVVLDTVVGSIPVLGNVFDLFFKANSRNLRMMRQHYTEKKHQGSVWPVVLGVFGFLAVLSTALLVIMFAAMRRVFG